MSEGGLLGACGDLRVAVGPSSEESIQIPMPTVQPTVHIKSSTRQLIYSEADLSDTPDGQSTGKRHVYLRKLGFSDLIVHNKIVPIRCVGTYPCLTPVLAINNAVFSVSGASDGDQRFLSATLEVLIE